MDYIEGETSIIEVQRVIVSRGSNSPEVRKCTNCRKFFITMDRKYDYDILCNMCLKMKDKRKVCKYCIIL